MDIQKFVKLRPYLYHLTDQSNLPSILSDYELKSTVGLTEIVGLQNREEFLRTRRIGHKKIMDGSHSFMIRDQDPLSEAITKKNLEAGMTFGDFIYLLNSRVFFWAKESDLIGHYKRYENQNEHPVILRVSTAETFALNQVQPKFCRLNSGAPRCNSHYKEGAPPRGNDTFLSAENYDRLPSSIREVTFEGHCKLPNSPYISSHPTKAFEQL